MPKHGKKYAKASEVASKEVLPVERAINSIKELAYAKFNESVDVSVNLSIDPTKGDQVVRGSVLLPHGRGEKVRVLVFAKGEFAEEAQKAGADYVGADDLVEKIESGWIDFEYAVATPDVMGVVGRLAKILGPRGLLPNKKIGTVTFDVAKIVSELKKGRAFFKNDKGGSVHFSFGKISFSDADLLDNLKAFTKALVASKPATAKGRYLKKMTISSTMGVGMQVNPEEVVR